MSGDIVGDLLKVARKHPAGRMAPEVPLMRAAARALVLDYGGELPPESIEQRVEQFRIGIAFEAARLKGDAKAMHAAMDAMQERLDESLRAVRDAGISIDPGE